MEEHYEQRLSFVITKSGCQSLISALYICYIDTHIQYRRKIRCLYIRRTSMLNWKMTGYSSVFGVYHSSVYQVCLFCEPLSYSLRPKVLLCESLIGMDATYHLPLGFRQTKSAVRQR